VIARVLPEAGLSRLRERYEVAAGELRLDPGELRARAAGAAARVADPTVPVDAALLDAAGPGLRVVANFAVGFDNVDLDACRERRLWVTNTPDVLTNATAELALALMLAAARRIGEAERIVRAGRWEGWDPGGLLGRELSHSTIGIVGLGRIGMRVAELLSGFGARLVYCARSRHPDAERRLRVERLVLGDLLAQADVVTLHAPLGEDTRHMIDAGALERMRPGSILVNTARGGLVDAEALAAALRSGSLGAAGLDTYEREPEVPAGLLGLENVVLAPHIGSATARARDAMASLVADNVIAALDGRRPPAVVVEARAG
jgi:glyoxylate reductase